MTNGDEPRYGVADLTGEAQALRTAVAELTRKADKIPQLESKTAVLTIVVVFVALLGIGFAVLSYHARATAIGATERSECQAQVNVALIAALEGRTDAAQQDRGSMRALLASLLNPTTTPEARRDAVVHYDQRLAAADESRQSFPYPRTAC